MSLEIGNFAFAHRPIFRHCPEKQMRLDTVKILNALHWTLLTLLGVAAAVVIIRPDASVTLDAALILLATAASITALVRQLPVQNVLLAAAITALIGGAAHGLSARMSIPFGPMIFDHTSGWEIFGAVPWTLPLLWIVAIFNSRGMVRLILRPWRKTKNYGWWLIGLTALLAVAFDVALEPYAQPVKHLWRGLPTKLAANWHGASPLNFLGWAFISLFILAFITPSLIRKQPNNPSAPDFAPLALWVGGIAFFAVSSAAAGLWSAVIVDAVFIGIATVFAVRGARW
jgi:uncharacterized membrane protein